MEGYITKETWTGRYQNGELFLKHSRLIQTPIIKMANFFRIIKMANIFYQNGELFQNYQNGELFFIKMANFFLSLFSKWRIFCRSHEMSQRFDS